MNSAELLDSRKALMPLADTKSEVNQITYYVDNFSYPDIRVLLNAKICTRNVRNIMLVGSGDSYALALLYAALFNHITGLCARGVQSHEFISENLHYLNETWLVLIISASGRPSPVVDALVKAQSTTAQIVGITNNDNNVFARQARTLICTGATKKGMPTLSNIATALYLDSIACMLSPEYENRFEQEIMKFKSVLSESQETTGPSGDPAFLDIIFRKRITVIGNGSDYGLALLFSNLLWCGPQRFNYALQLEEYSHALRLNQSSPDDLIIIFDCTGNNSALVKKTINHLILNKASFKHITRKELSLFLSGNIHLFNDHDDCRYSAMMFIFYLTISATEIFLSGGGSRVTLE